MHTAIITGAGSGIGSHAAELLAAEGYAVVLVGRTESKLDDAADRIAEAVEAATVEAMPTDVTDPEAVERLIAAVQDKFGRVDVLCNVAGDAPLNPIPQNTYAAWRRCIDTNLTAVVLLTSRLFPVMEEQGGGTIVNVSSMASFDPFPGFSMYAAAKVGVNMFTRSTAEEGKDKNISAVCVAPGAVETGMLRGLFSEEVIPKESALDPRDVARAVVDCATGKRGYDPGETIAMPSP